MRNKKQHSPSFLNYIMGRIDFYRKLGNEQRADRYYSAFEKLRKFTQGKAEKFAMTRPKAPNIPQKTHDLICELAKEAFRHGFLKALESIDEINYMFSKIDMGNEQLN